MIINKVEEVKTRLVHLEDKIDLDYSSNIQELLDLVGIDYYTELISIKHAETYIDNYKEIYVYKVKYKKVI